MGDLELGPRSPTTARQRRDFGPGEDHNTVRGCPRPQPVCGGLRTSVQATSGIGRSIICPGSRGGAAFLGS